MEYQRCAAIRWSKISPDPEANRTMQGLAQPFPSLQHDHDDCISTAMEAAEGLCRQRGLRFTALRRRVLTLVWQSHKPVGAYEILDKLGEEGRKAAPPTVSRDRGSQ